MIIFIDDDHLLSLVDGQALLHGHLLQVHVAGELESNLEEKIFNSMHSVFFNKNLGCSSCMRVAKLTVCKLIFIKL